MVLIQTKNYTILQLKHNWFREKSKSLLFEYNPNALLGVNYHITEVKHVVIDSVDYGANTNSWNETIIQLWESPYEKR